MITTTTTKLFCPICGQELNKPVIKDLEITVDTKEIVNEGYMFDHCKDDNLLVSVIIMKKPNQTGSK